MSERDTQASRLRVRVVQPRVLEALRARVVRSVTVVGAFDMTAAYQRLGARQASPLRGSEQGEELHVHSRSSTPESWRQVVLATSPDSSGSDDTDSEQDARASATFSGRHSAPPLLLGAGTTVLNLGVRRVRAMPPHCDSD